MVAQRGNANTSLSNKPQVAPSNSNAKFEKGTEKSKEKL